ncbi:RING finger and CHY zinc finger domain-containing protein [Martensiomyces pterosporus]|nr:RING finger and CHY zinc finger domain-containing protein [Martensiomyces pterosporus]
MFCENAHAKENGEGSASDKFSVSFNDEQQRILGCPHYRLKAKVLAPCCNRWVACRFCHDDTSQHSMDRFSVERMKCMLCFEEQTIGQTCVKCRQVMGRYYCDSCRLIDDDESKDVYHCDQCGICRRGKQSQFYHCAVCDACVSVCARTSHGCKEMRLRCNCPICGHGLFESTSNIIQPRCEHLMHEDCLNEYIGYSYKCPICSRSLCDTRSIFETIECYLKCSTMPAEYKNTLSHIFCNDCQQRSFTRYHFLYHKCQHCSSFNTAVLSTSNASDSSIPPSPASDAASI